MIGVILANTGSPSSPDPDDIERYLSEFLMDERIRQLPKPVWKWLVTRKILPKRKYSSAQRYRFIWQPDGSPLLAQSCALAGKVQDLFNADRASDDVSASDTAIIVRSAMSYGSPSIAEVLADFRDAGVDRVVLLPLYPQSAYSPTMAVVDSFWRAQDQIGWHPDSTVIDNYHDDEGYIAAIVRSIRNVGFDAPAGDRLLLSLHAIPLKDEAAGDTYREQIAESVELIANGLGIDPDAITVAYQSVFGNDPSKWTAPLTRDVLASWHDGDFRVVFACPGFSVDCLETLYDVPNEMVPALEGEAAKPVVDHVGTDIQAACNTSGRFVWVPSLNATDEHAELIKAVIERSLQQS